MRIGYGGRILAASLVVAGLAGCAAPRFSENRIDMFGTASIYAKIGRVLGYDKSDRDGEYATLISSVFDYRVSDESAEENLRRIESMFKEDMGSGVDSRLDKLKNFLDNTIRMDWW